MSNRIYTTTFTIPAGTPIATPFVQGVVLDDEHLDRLRIVIPDGPAGLTGLAVTWGGTQIAPYQAGTWVSGNDETIDYDYDGEVTAAGLVLAGYNLDVWPHSFILRWFMSLLTTTSPVVISSAQAAPGAAQTQLRAVAALSSGGR